MEEAAEAAPPLRAEDIVETIREPLVVLDAALRVVAANTAFYSTFRLPPGEAEGRPLFELGERQWEIADLRDRLERVLPCGERLEDFEVEREFREIGRRVMLLYARPVRQDGECRNILLAIEDVTARKDAERALVEAHERLEERISERTAQLIATNTALEKEVAERRRREQELQQFFYMASHDLQEPLRKITVFGGQLQSRAAHLGEKGADQLARILSAAERMRHLLNDLLSLSRVSTRAQTFRPVSLNGIVSEALAEFRKDISATGARVAVGELFEIDGDPDQMRLLFQNLIGNALKFRRPEVPPVIEITGNVCASDGTETGEIVIKDNGIGFEPRFATRIFEVFERLHGRSEYDGTGIGLALCRKIVERHGGQISAAGVPDDGAEFRVVLPLQAPERAAANG